ncbi:hypothetical protein TSMEX_003121 [Taenia solium]|eukprot:TsM_000154500 transcript=TsM_000154500 gene=TsM_000154500
MMFRVQLNTKGTSVRQLHSSKTYILSIKNAPEISQKIPEAKTVGTYNWFVKHRQFEWQRDTNLKPVNLPQITSKSTVCANTDKLPCFHEERKYQRRLRCFENYFKEDVNCD